MNKNTLYSVGIGIGTGVLMAIVMLVGMVQIDYSYRGLPFVLLTIIACALPFCISCIERWAFSVITAKVVMIITSMCICVLYGFYMQNSSVYDTQILKVVMICTCLSHGISLVINVLMHHIKLKK